MIRTHVPSAARRFPRPLLLLRRLLPVLLAPLLLTATLSACVGMPDTGPVVDIDPPAQDGSRAGTFYDPRPPAVGSSSREIVNGFLEAMKATPIRTSVAKQFLSARARATWRPERATITYTDLEAPVGERSVSLGVLGAERYDSRGAWERKLDEQESRLSFPMVREGDEWRIDEAPDALLVPASWFEERFVRTSLQFLDPTGSILVPEPVFVPAGDQLATALVGGLLLGPPEELGQVTRSAMPPGLRLATSSVPISADGLAEVALAGAGEEFDAVSEEMAAQIAWTLRQEPRVRAVQVTLDGRRLPLPGGVSEIPREAGARFDPDALGASDEVFALRDGLLVRGRMDELEATAGPLGVAGAGLVSAAVNLRGTVAAGVSRSGSVSVAPLSDPGGAVTEVVAGATDLLPPAWDFADRLWLLDRTAAGARVSVAVGTKVREVVVPGLTGTQVKAFQVSRDGSRLVAVVRGARRDRLVVSRVLHGSAGRVLRATPAREIDLDVEPGHRITDIGWRSATSVSVLSAVAGDVSQVRTVAVDGAPGELADTGALRIPGRASALVSSPEEGASPYVVGKAGVTDLLDPGRRLSALEAGVTWIGYVG
ncbi:LpqB family beta-propeller domain-containing protein [Nocardioides sp. 616]|uniref:LpqB family beta-propeller domain-containing protein n=1 Tax=Nocardioides sp. 616 TaxID=2268090 RepID=UPI000CE364CF|nr:LpqB family beta-propeller domain-containing protein [Nocardioides sp. 616]